VVELIWPVSCKRPSISSIFCSASAGFSPEIIKLTRRAHNCSIVDIPGNSPGISVSNADCLVAVSTSKHPSHPFVVGGPVNGGWVVVARCSSIVRSRA